MRPHEPAAGALAALPSGHFAVLDGARDPNLAFHLDAWNLTPLPLYLEAGELEVIWNGPVLGELPPAAVAHGWLPLPPAENVTFWSWPGDALSLRRHLRSINLVEVPEQAVFEGGEGRHTVIFRHWDANVLAAILPLLSAAQQARLWGEATGLVLDAPDAGGVRAARRPAGLPPKPPGMLGFDMAQMAALADVRVAVSHQRIAGYLREVAPAQTQGLDDRTLIARIGGWAQEAAGLGIATERDIGRWAFLQCMTNGAMLSYAGLSDFFAVAGRTPSASLDAMFAEVEYRLRRGI